MLLTFIMLGATLGFLLHNFYPAKIFCGDCAMFLGFIIAIITLLEFKGPALTSLFVPIMILGIPILDTLFAIIRRALKGENISKADKFHIHHEFLSQNNSFNYLCDRFIICNGFNTLYFKRSILGKSFLYIDIYSSSLVCI